MDILIERACGMDVHKDSITACVMTPEGKEIQTFSTKTVFLLQLIDWIKKHGCTHARWKVQVYSGSQLLTY
jgi:transposase